MPRAGYMEFKVEHVLIAYGALVLTIAIGIPVFFSAAVAVGEQKSLQACQAWAWRR